MKRINTVIIWIDSVPKLLLSKHLLGIRIEDYKENIHIFVHFE